MDSENVSGLYLEACFHLNIRTRLKGKITKKDLPVMVETLKRTARGSGGGPFRPSPDPALYKNVLKKYVLRLDKRIDDEVFHSYLVRALAEMDASVRRAFFNELAWFAYDNGLDGFGGSRFLEGVYEDAGIGRRPYERYAAKFRPGGGKMPDSAMLRSARRSTVRTAVLLCLLLLVVGAAAYYYSSIMTPAERVVLPESRLTCLAVRFERAVAAGPVRGEDRSAGRTDIYMVSGSVEVWFDISGLRLESEGEGYRAVYARNGDYVFSPLRAGVMLDSGKLGPSMSVVLGAGTDRARIEPLGFVDSSGPGCFRIAVSDGEPESPPVYRFTGALADAAPLLGRGVSAGWLASGGLVAGVAAGNAPLQERLERTARKLIAARVLFDLPSVEVLRRTFERMVSEHYGRQGKRIVGFEYREGGS